MPEGPSIVIASEAMQQFVGKTVTDVEGNTKVDIEQFKGLQVADICSWGKHLLICFENLTVRIHFLMFGTYRINERKETPIRLGFTFEDGSELNLYTCSVKILEGDVNNHYDWSGDVMNSKWDPAKAKQKLSQMPNVMACDALLEQDVFSGVGNIIKNEVLYRVGLHPESLIGRIPGEVLDEMILQSRNYSFEFLEWKKEFTLKKHWLAHTKKICLRCDLPFIKKYTGVKKRRSFFCENCQTLY